MFKSVMRRVGQHRSSGRGSARPAIYGGGSSLLRSAASEVIGNPVGDVVYRVGAVVDAAVLAAALALSEDLELACEAVE